MQKLLIDIFGKETPPIIKEDGVFVTSEIIGTVLLVSDAFLKNKENYVIIASNMYVAQKIYSTLQSFLDTDDIIFYPNDDLLFSEILSESRQFIANRIYALHESFGTEKHRVYITSLSGVLRPVINKETFKNKVIKLKSNEQYGFKNLLKTLQVLGYKRVSKIDQTMQYAVRGDIVDFFSVNENFPTRIEFFDDVIESIRSFEISTQQSVKKRDEITLLPASEFPLNEVEEKRFLEDLKTLYEQTENKEKYKEYFSELIEAVLNKKELIISRYFACSKLFSETLLSYVRKPNIIYANYTQILSSYEVLKEQADYYITKSANEAKMLPNITLYHDFNLVSQHKTSKIEPFSEKQDDFIFPIYPVVNIINKEDMAHVLLQNIDEKNEVYLAINNKKQAEQLEKFIKQNLQLKSAFQGDKIKIINHYFPHGFHLKNKKIILFTTQELFNIKRQETRYNERFKQGTIIRNYEQLNEGDYVVHEYHGIGRFIDITKRQDDKLKRDYIKIQYGGEDLLFIPLEQIHLIRRYSGREGIMPRLHKLNSTVWKKTKSRLEKRINEIAEELVSTHAIRLKTPGLKFPGDDDFQNEFELAFPHELTPDQKQALDEIKTDMEAPYVMDRLLCGDVGFGKTEIALRAAFKAISAGKQVVFLCPTTLLARQHFEVSVDRFESFGVRIGLLSRLVTQKKRQETLEQFKNGEIHLLIGTHTLLNIDFNNTNVGLLIVDEEQRFGVEQKEKIKSLKLLIDVLTLSATPIPRTLQMSLVGIRSLSQINTPPEERMPIQTYVLKRDDAVVKELIERELNRGGQVFYLHNRVQTIYHVASKIARNVKNAKIGVVHGQMDKNDIEDVMTKFYENEIDILIATSIIENGIDVPNANVIIVEEADKFGLAQLYQIKGRVGRGNRIAYAYLLYNPLKKMTESATKRLQAIQEFTDLGSGYKIAERDLLIRGAGDILGAEQSGFIDTVGIDMYLKMLNDAISEKKEEEEPIKKVVSISGVETYIPDDYANKSEKFEIYLDISNATNVLMLRDVYKKTRDMFGPIPEALELLFRKREIELIISSRLKYIEQVKDSLTYLDIIPGTTFYEITGALKTLSDSLTTNESNIRFVTQDGKIIIRMNKINNWFNEYDLVINKIVNIVREGSVKNAN